ncbi:MAG TPA: PH domain-containing protein [Candidatus Limnocylindria bacterium]|nr:PH domain-containing protein [Candidatus Limnocylindria bacterium]
MSYARNLLSRNEEVVYESRQHWFAVIARMWIWILVALIALAISVWIGTNEAVLGNPTVDGGITVVAVVGLIGALAYLGFVIWDWRNQEWLITTRRVIRAEGVLNKSVTDSSLEKINDARLDQSVLGRIFGYGTLDILTASEEATASNLADFPMIANPVEFKKTMFDQKQMLEQPDLAPPRYQRQAPMPDMQPAEPMPPRAGSDRVAVAEAGAAQPAAAAPAPAPAQTAEPVRKSADDIGATLERLAGLRDKGLITAEEYEAKKRELLERM